MSVRSSHSEPRLESLGRWIPGGAQVQRQLEDLLPYVRREVPQTWQKTRIGAASKVNRLDNGSSVLYGCRGCVDCWDRPPLFLYNALIAVLAPDGRDRPTSDRSEDPRRPALLAGGGR